MFYKWNKFDEPGFQQPSVGIGISTTNLGELYWLTNLKQSELGEISGFPMISLPSKVREVAIIQPNLGDPDWDVPKSY